MKVQTVAAGWVMLAALWSAPVAARQVPAPAPASPRTPATAEGDQPPAQVDVSELPISVDRIQRQLERAPEPRLELLRPVFRAEVIERRPKWFADIDWLPDQDPRLPVPAGPAWHREFLTMVTPPTAMPFGQSTGWDLLQLMATSLVQGMTTKSLAAKVKEAAAERRAAEAKQEVDEAISRWKDERKSEAPVASPPPPPRF